MVRPMKSLDISRLLQPVFATAENGFAARPVLLRGRGSDEVRGSKPSALRSVVPAEETAEMYAPVRSLRLIVRWDNGPRGNSFNNGLCRTVASLTSGRGSRWQVNWSLVRGQRYADNSQSVNRLTGFFGRLRRKTGRVCRTRNFAAKSSKTRCPQLGLNGGSDEEARYHRGNAYWQHNILRDPRLPARVSGSSRFGGAGHGGRAGWTTWDTCQRRGCGAQNYAARGTALRGRRHLLNCGS